MSDNILDEVEFRGLKLSEWLEQMYIEPTKYMLTAGEWDPQSLQTFITDVLRRQNRAGECLSIARAQYQGARRANRRRFTNLLDDAVARTGGKGQVTALKAGVEAKMVDEYDREALLESIKDFWELQESRLTRMAEGGRQLAYLQSARSRLE